MRAPPFNFLPPCPTPEAIQFLRRSLFSMPRRYRRRSYRNRDKYSIEHSVLNLIYPNPVVVPAGDSSVETNNWAIPILAPTDVQGMRKVKHFTLTFSSGISEGARVVYALVFVPQGYTPQPIAMPSAGSGVPLYSANQFVISSGLLDFNAGPLRIRSPLSRNLNSGDSVYLVIGIASSITVSPGDILAEVKYAITLQ